jgi:hypothetical protein
MQTPESNRQAPIADLLTLEPFFETYVTISQTERASEPLLSTAL